MTDRASLPRPGRHSTASDPRRPGGSPTAQSTGSATKRERRLPRITRVPGWRGGAGPLGPHAPVSSSYQVRSGSRCVPAATPPAPSTAAPRPATAPRRVIRIGPGYGRCVATR